MGACDDIIIAQSIGAKSKLQLFDFLIKGSFISFLGLAAYWVEEENFSSLVTIS